MSTTLRSTPPRPGWPLRKRSSMTLVEVSQHAFLRFWSCQGRICSICLYSFAIYSWCNISKCNVVLNKLVLSPDSSDVHERIHIDINRTRIDDIVGETHKYIYFRPFQEICIWYQGLNLNFHLWANFLVWSSTPVHCEACKSSGRCHRCTRGHDYILSTC